MNEKISPYIIFFGTPEFAVPSLQTLAEHGYDIAAVVTNPDEPAGRKNVLTPPAVKIAATGHGTPVFQPTSLTAPDVQKELRELAPDLIVTAAYGKIIPKEVLAIPKYGALNVHPSLLPRWRGPAPIQYTILHGDTVTGVTIMQMDELMDHGPIVASTSYKPQATSLPNYLKLHDALAQLGADLLIETLPKYLNGEITPTPQNHSKATYSNIITKADGRIDWSRPAEEIERRIRAFAGWPGAWTTWPSLHRIRRIRIDSADIAANAALPPTSPPGHVWRDTTHALAVRAGTGSIAIRTLTVDGRNTTDAASFVRGNPGIIGETLI